MSAPFGISASDLRRMDEVLGVSRQLARGPRADEPFPDEERTDALLGAVARAAPRPVAGPIDREGMLRVFEAGLPQALAPAALTREDVERVLRAETRRDILAGPGGPFEDAPISGVFDPTSGVGQAAIDITSGLVQGSSVVARGGRFIGQELQDVGILGPTPEGKPAGATGLGFISGVADAAEKLRETKTILPISNFPDLDTMGLLMGADNLVVIGGITALGRGAVFIRQAMKAKKALKAAPRSIVGEATNLEGLRDGIIRAAEAQGVRGARAQKVTEAVDALNRKITELRSAAAAESARVVSEVITPRLNRTVDTIARLEDELVGFDEALSGLKSSLEVEKSIPMRSKIETAMEQLLRRREVRQAKLDQAQELASMLKGQIEQGFESARIARMDAARGRASAELGQQKRALTGIMKQAEQEQQLIETARKLYNEAIVSPVEIRMASAIANAAGVTGIQLADEEPLATAILSGLTAGAIGAILPITLAAREGAGNVMFRPIAEDTVERMLLNSPLAKLIGAGRAHGDDAVTAVGKSSLDEMAEGAARKVDGTEGTVSGETGFHVEPSVARYQSEAEKAGGGFWARMNESRLDRDVPGIEKAFRQAFSSIDRMLRALPEPLRTSGVRVANAFVRSRAESSRVGGESRRLLALPMRLAKRDPSKFRETFIAAEAAPQLTAAQYGLNGPLSFQKILAQMPKDDPVAQLRYFFDVYAPWAVQHSGSGLDLNMLRNYVPRFYAQDSPMFLQPRASKNLRVWLRSAENRRRLIERAQQRDPNFKIPNTPEEFLRKLSPPTRFELRELLSAAPKKTFIDFERVFPITYRDAVELGMPVVDAGHALRKYVNDLGDRIGLAKHLGGPTVPTLREFLSLAESRDPHLASILTDASFRAMGFGQPMSDFARAFSAFGNVISIPSTMVLAPLSNMGQSVNTIAEIGVRAYAQATREIARNWKAIARGGYTDDEFFNMALAFAREVTEETRDFMTGRRPGIQKIGQWMLDYGGMRQTEFFNKLSAAVAGKNWFVNTVQKMRNGTLPQREMRRIQRDFDKLGMKLDDFMMRNPTTDELFAVGTRIADMTQFRIVPAELPSYWSSPHATLFRTLKSFAFLQGRFVKDRVLGPAGTFVKTGGRDGSLRPLATFLTLFPAIGGSVGALRRTITGQEQVNPLENPADWMIDAIAWTGGVGLFGDFVTSAKMGRDQLLRGAFSPSVVQSVQLASAFMQSVAGKDTTPLKRAIRDVMPAQQIIRRPVGKALGVPLRETKPTARSRSRRKAKTLQRAPQ